MLFVIGTYNARSSKEEIPKSCQFPSEVQHVTQLVNMERLRQADLRSASIGSETGISANPSPFKENITHFLNKVADVC